MFSKEDGEIPFVFTVDFPNDDDIMIPCPS
jgi:hypothetical protein